MNPKHKPVTIGGHEYVLAPLKMKEIEDLVEGPMDPSESYAAKRERTWQTIHASLTRAAKETGAAVPSVEELKERHDLEEYLDLHAEALIVSKVRPPKTQAA